MKGEFSPNFIFNKIKQIQSKQCSFIVLSRIFVVKVVLSHAFCADWTKFSFIGKEEYSAR